MATFSTHMTRLAGSHQMRLREPIASPSIRTAGLPSCHGANCGCFWPILGCDPAGIEGSTENPSTWELLHLEPGSDYVGALAVHGRGVSVSARKGVKTKRWKVFKLPTHFSNETPWAHIRPILIDIIKTALMSIGVMHNVPSLRHVIGRRPQ